MTPKLCLLTNRETEVLECLLNGSTLEDIAADSGTSIGTVRTQVKRIRQKLGGLSITQTVALAFRLLDDPEDNRWVELPRR